MAERFTTIGKTSTAVNLEKIRVSAANAAASRPDSIALPEEVERIVITQQAARPLLTVPIRDNTSFVTKFDKKTFTQIVTRPTRTVIVDQDPDPGDFVPAGTPINVKLTVKDAIPTGTFTGIDVALARKFANIGALSVDLEKPDDPISKNAKSALDKKVDYAVLSAADKDAVDTFMASRLEAIAVDTAEKKAKVYGDIQFLHHL